MEGLRKEMVGSAVTQILLPARNDWDPEIGGAKRRGYFSSSRTGSHCLGQRKPFPRPLKFTSGTL